MEWTIPPPLRDPSRPKLALPPGACDAHCHVFGPAHRFPFDPDRTYTPPDSGFEELIALQEKLGLTRAVLVQASCHGTDNSAMVDALLRGQGRFAGVAMVEDSIEDEELADLHRAGVRGVRFNFVRHLGDPTETSRVLAMAERVAHMGWHVVLHFDADQISRFAEMLHRLSAPFIIDHMGRVEASKGVDQEPFRVLLDLLETEEKAWVKISGAERLTGTGGPPYEDVVPLAKALVDAAPERALWGTDWPHPNVPHMPDDGNLVDLLADFAPDDETRRRILVDNPQRLYDFG